MNARIWRSALIVAALCALWMTATFSGWADLRIVEVTDGQQSETLYKNNRIASSGTDGLNSIMMCETGELIAMSPSGGGGRYWVGSYQDFVDTLEGLSAQADQLDAGMGDMGDMGDLGDLFSALFGGGGEDLSQLKVRVSKVGDDTIAGYASEHYRVETSVDGTWRVREELWLSADLLREIRAEASVCIDYYRGIQDGFVGIGGFGLDEMFKVMESPEYRALHDKGFIVKSRSSYPGVFGMVADSDSEVKEVIHESISEDYFTVPSNYQQVSTIFELME